jgi:hypothetical protein
MAYIPMAQAPGQDDQLTTDLVQQLLARRGRESRPPQNEVGQAFYGLGDAITGALGAYAGHKLEQQQDSELKALGEALSKNLPPDQQALAEALLGNRQTAPLAVGAIAKGAFSQGMTEYQRQRLEIDRARANKPSEPAAVCEMRAFNLDPAKPADVEPLRQFDLRHEQEHYDRGQTLAPFSGPIGCAPEASQLPALPAERSSQAVDDQE